VDDRTLVVQLCQPCPYFLDLAAFPIFLPCHESIELLRERDRGAPITAEGLVVYDPQWTKPDYHRNQYPGLITNGPYRVGDWTFKRRVRLTVNPHHRLARAISCRTVDMLVYENISASIMAYEAGEVDFLPAMDVPYDHEIARLARSGERCDFHLCHVLGTYFFNFNCTSASIGGQPNPFVDRKIRKAFSLAVDKTQIVEKVLKRGDRVAHSFVPPDSIPGYEPPGGLRFDPEQALALLAEAGCPGGAGLPPVELLYTPRDEVVCQAVARMWEDALGVRVELRSKEPKTFAEDKANHHYMVARGNWFADYNDPTTFLDCLSTGNGNNDSGYSNPKYDALLVEASLQSEGTHRAALLRQAEAIVVQEDLPILPILHYATPIAIKPHIKGLYPNARLWFPFYNVTIQR
jgi:oligopeptide transport system substrate-binding protein